MTRNTPNVNLLCLQQRSDPSPSNPGPTEKYVGQCPTVQVITHGCIQMSTNVVDHEWWKNVVNGGWGLNAFCYLKKKKSSFEREEKCEWFVGAWMWYVVNDVKEGIGCRTQQNDNKWKWMLVCWMRYDDVLCVNEVEMSTKEQLANDCECLNELKKTIRILGRNDTWPARDAALRACVEDGAARPC